MNRIILTYSPANTPAADRIDQDLSRIGIPFEHISSAAGDFAQRIAETGEPLLLLVTDNLMKDRHAMSVLQHNLSTMAARQTVVPVLADGIDEQGQAVPTQLDRMVHMLHYMNHWQGEWMKISADFQAAPAEQKAGLESELGEVREIANHISDLITTIRELNPLTLQELEARDYAMFFQRFDLSDWHGQYKKLAAQVETGDAVPAPELLPETPLDSGILAPLPMEEPAPETDVQTQPTPEPEPQEEPADEPVFEPSVLPEAENTTDQIELTIRDARFWIDRGYRDRGVELLRIAAEEYPSNERIAAAYREAVAEEPAAEISVTPPSSPAPAAVATSGTVDPNQNVQSYELMGDMALQKGEYLFAKYCWDRVAEVNPDHPGIYRKLGLMTAEHLHDYSETAVHYLRKALEVDPYDEEVKRCLAELSGETTEHQSVPVTEQPAVTPDLPEVQEPVTVPEETPAQKPEATQPAETVLITGATSGIGRATADVFARNGYRLVLTGRRVDRLVELKNHFESAYGSDVLLLPFDVRDHGAVEAALCNLPDAYRDIDILVNNAGLAKGLSPIHEGSLEHWETMIDTNVKGLLYVTRVVSPGMVARKKGHIINVCSSAGKEVYPNGNVYCATKFAVDALTKAIRFDLHAHNIRVSQVSPGHVEETEFAITRFDGDADRARIYQDFQPLKASDVADVIYFMATRPSHVNIQDVQMFATQQASSMIINRSGR